MSYILNNPGQLWALLIQHLYMTALSLAISTPVALLLALLIHRFKQLNTVVMGTLGILYTIPSIALIILLLPIFGLNSTSVIIALVIYTQIILVRNIVAGLNGNSSCRQGSLSGFLGGRGGAFSCFRRPVATGSRPRITTGISAR